MDKVRKGKKLLVASNTPSLEKVVISDYLNAWAIDIVRCGECKYYNEDKCWNLKGLNKTDGAVKADDFCSYGERIDNE